MLNYIWAGLIIISLVFAVIHDVRDEINDTYRNGRALPIQVLIPGGFKPNDRLTDVEIRVDPATFARFYGTKEIPDSTYQGVLVRAGNRYQLRFASDSKLPSLLETVKGYSSSRDEELQGAVGPMTLTPGVSMARIAVTFNPVRLVKLKAITAAAFEFAQTAATIAIGLIGILTLWLGLLRIAEKAGIINALVRVTQPIFRPLFPEIPAGHPALGMIVLNLTANMLGLGNAATPMGLKAMEELQKLSPDKNTASNSMVMLLALNTASVQLVPPTLLLAVMGMQINELIFPIITCTILSACIAVIAAKVLGKMKRYRSTDPNLIGPTGDLAGIPTNSNEG